MPRVHYRKARKDYPNQGIEKGDMYYYTKMKTGPRSSRVLRSKTPFKQSQLTNSPFKSGWYAASEGWDASDKNDEAMRATAEALRELGQEAQDSYDNMPEGLQEGDTGQLLNARAEGCESKADELEALADEWEGLEEPEEPDAFDPSDYAEEMSAMDPEDAGEFLSEKEQDWQTECDEYQTTLAENEQERERIRDEAQDIINYMPEY